jgi:hypothetical protein
MTGFVTGDESTPRNGFQEPDAGKVTENDVDGKKRWTVESGMW